MSERLSPVDASFLSLERDRTPAQIGSLYVLSPPRAGFDYDMLVQLVEQRISQVPRYRQKVRNVPGGIARPVWVDDNDFDISFHVRRSALPAPGNDAQLYELVSRLLSRRLDRSRPLWEMYLVEGLAKGRFAVISKTHQAMVGGVGAPSMGQVIFDDTRRARVTRGELWMPSAEPGAVRLLAGALTGMLQRPVEVVDAVRWVARDATAAVSNLAAAAGNVSSALQRAVRPAPPSPLNVVISRQRRFAVARTRLADYRAVRSARGGEVNDVVLAVVTGALRSWLLARGEAMTLETTVRALAPMAVTAENGDVAGAGAGGMPDSRAFSFFIDLPVGEPNPLARISRIAHATKAHESKAGSASHRQVGADTLTHLSGFAPPTLHAMGARVAGSLMCRSFNVLITNVPGPQQPVYAAGARMLEMFPVVPLTRNQALSVGLTSYDGGVFYGLNADRDAMPDIEMLARLIEKALDELVQAVQ